ncbi:MAG TPA: hypothetical protein VJ957_11365 [Longimicrobiales bacterium]|nr:hypothetical protein [Longimicrobiales bacterium]
MRTFEFIRRRGLLVALLGAVVLSSGACDAVNRLMEVKNPERLREQDLSDDKLVDVLVNSAQGDFQAAYAGTFVWIGEMLTDEAITGINWEDYKRANLRQVIYYEGPADNMFTDLQGARYTSELSSSKLKDMDPSKVSGDDLAKTLGYAGYAYIMLGDAMCGADLDEGSTVYTPDQLYQMAIDKLTEVLTTATSDSLKNWANVGLARAHLDRLEYADAMAAAQQVPAGFVYWAQYADDGTGRGTNALYGEVHGANFTMSVHPRFMYGGLTSYRAGHVDDALQTDPRIQFASDAVEGHDAITPLFKPYQSMPFSGYTGNTIANGAVQDDPNGVPLYDRGTSMQLASYLEAQHIYYEAGLMSGTLTDAQVEAFVNQRRAYGNETAVSGLTGTALREALREERARDLFLGGFRLGDLRRYARQPNPTAANSFPTGTFPSAERGDYRDSACFPIPLSEYQGNRNLPDPNVGG